ncbi:AAA family ATPase [Nocardioides humilatus]|nr:AAA family ATPase [Nocardioides humilatus]
MNTFNNDDACFANIVSTTAPTRWTAQELLELDFPEIKWAVEGWIAEGVTVLAGAPKIGKSWLCLDLALAVASGGVVFGNIDVDQGAVLYAALEDTGRRLRDRLRLVLNDRPAPSGLTFETQARPFNDMLDYIRGWVDHTPDARLVIIDVLSKIRPANVKNDYAEDYRVMSAIKKVADECGVAIVVVHHKRKQEATDPLDQISGTNGITGAADASMVLSRPRTSPEASLFITGRDVEEKESPLMWDASAHRWILLDGPVGLGDGAARTIYNYLASGVTATPTEIAKATGLPDGTIKGTLTRMIDADQVSRTKGRYFVAATTPDGHATGLVLV